MDWKSGLRHAADEFVHHKLRTFLTLLGMIFGVGAVISMLAIGQGARERALTLIDALGLRNVIVEAIAQPEERMREIREESLGLSRRDLELALDTLPQVDRHAATKSISSYAVFSSKGQSDAEVLGVSPSYFEMSGLAFVNGRPLTEDEDRLRAPVCALGEQVARDLFGTHDPIGREVKVNHVWLRVVGIVSDRQIQASEFEGVGLSSPRNRIYVPLETAIARFRFKPMEEELDTMQLEVASEASVGSVAATLDRLLETRHGDVKDYRLVVPERLLAQHEQTQRIFDIVMASIAGISLLVGGIGIMNIMLATVLERTREIGIRRAVGAKRADIRRQFLIEALAISLVGGFIGVLFGFGLAALISTYSGWPFAWSLMAPATAVTVCALTGLGFGLYPAIQAAKLDPIEALRRDL